MKLEEVTRTSVAARIRKKITGECSKYGQYLNTRKTDCSTKNPDYKNARYTNFEKACHTGTTQDSL